MFNWFGKRYIIEFEYIDCFWNKTADVKIIRAKDEDNARDKFHWWAFRQDFVTYSLMHIKEAVK